MTSTTQDIQAIQVTSPKSSGKKARSSALEEWKKSWMTMDCARSSLVDIRKLETWLVLLQKTCRGETLTKVIAAQFHPKEENIWMQKGTP